MYLALYRKWRPKTFDDVISQEHITTTLRREVVQGTTAHAYLFTGPRGTVRFEGNQAVSPITLARAEQLDFRVIDTL